MNVILIVPTGIGAAIGGHAGDANPVAKLLAGCCDTLITHPNVLNASDINEKPPNCLYVDGYHLDKFMVGHINLKPVRQNKVLVVTNSPIQKETLYSIQAAHHTLGADIGIMSLDVPLKMIAKIDENGVATGRVEGHREAIEQLSQPEWKRFDVIALHTPIMVDKGFAHKYLTEGGVNPWGGVEAKASRLIAAGLKKMVAHAPLESDTLQGFEEWAGPRMAAEMVSVSYLHCVLKGLHDAPRIVEKISTRPWTPGGLSIDEVDALVVPNIQDTWYMTNMYRKQIPVIIVEENETCLPKHILHDYGPEVDPYVVRVANYLEAAGYLMAMKAGVLSSSVMRD